MNKFFNSLWCKSQSVLRGLSRDPATKLVGKDKYGNKFIQYYKDDGSEWKRVMMPPDTDQQKGYWH